MDDRHRGTGTRRRLRRSLSLGSAALAIASGLALAASSGAWAVTASPAWPKAHGITLPNGASSTVGSQLLGVGCTPSGAYCVAGGYYATSSTSGALPMIVTYSNGSWGQARRLTLPSDAASVPKAEVTSVSCPAAASCVAFGYYRYQNSGTKRNAFVAQQSASGWARAHTLPMPKNVLLPTNAWSSKITCPSKGNCTAVGVYVDKDKDHETFAINETAGKWVQGHWIWTPPDAPKIGKNVVPYGVACSSDTHCVAVGKYLTAGGAIEPYVVQGQTNAPWNATAQRVGLPPDALSGKTQQASLRGVQCFSAGSCFAVGDYELSTGSTPAVFSVTERRGTWDSHGTQFPAAPADAASPARSQANGLYCYGSTSCVMVGSYTSSSGLMSPLSDAYSGAPAWRPAAGVAAPPSTYRPASLRVTYWPASLRGTYRTASLRAVTCRGSAPWTCVAVPSGPYAGAPVWQPAAGVAPPSTYRSANFKDVACWGSAPWTCVAVGSYVNSSGHTRPMASESS